MDHDPQLYFADDGAPRSARFGDIYYSLQDGLDEARAVFLRGCHLPEDWAGFEDFTVLELGFGTGLNVAALIELWCEHRPAGGHLHVFTVEGFLMSAELAAQALANWPGLAPYAESLLAQWPKPRHGFHVMEFPQWRVTVTVATMPVAEALAAWAGRADAIFLDGFSPALNPDMWSDAIIRAVADKARSGTRLATFTVAGSVRRALAEAGFMVRKCPGFGRKRERLEAMFAPPHGSAIARRPRRMAILGAGIAGCAMAYQARHFGLEADVFDAEAPGSGASGNEAGLVTPRLDAGGGAISTLFADAHAYATGLYARLCPDAILPCDVRQLAAEPRDVGRFARIAAQPVFATGEMVPFAPCETGDVPDMAGMALKGAMAVRPDRVLAALLGGQAVISAKIASVEAGWLIDAHGRKHGPYDAIVLTAGAGVFSLPNVAIELDLRPVRGQVERVVGESGPKDALAWGGYAVPLPDGWLFGATHIRGDLGIDVREVDRQHNLDNLGKVMPALAAAIGLAEIRSRASTRVTTRDHLPAAGALGPGLFVLTGLGARGFCLAPLLAKAICCECLGAPSPMQRIAKMLLEPKRLKSAQPA